MADVDFDTLQLAHLDELSRRYQRALEAAGYDALLISSGAAPMRYGDDQAHHHQGYGPFLHWTGLTGVENSWLLIRPGQSPRLWLHTPVDFWHAPPERPTDAWTRVIEVTTLQSAGAPELGNVGQLAVIGDPIVLSGVPGVHNPPELVRAVENTRVHKTGYEIACLEQATMMAARGHDAARRLFIDGGSEFEINLAWQQATGQREADAPYHSIIGLNEHAGILHYQHYGHTRGPARSLLIDAGCRFRGYCSDITRTTAAASEPRFAALIAGLESLQRRLCDAVAPGLDYPELHRKAHLGIAALLAASGLVTGLDEPTMVEQGVTRAFFPHGLGHLLGIQVHDVGGKPVPPPADAPFLRLTRPLEAGMVLTIEPGLYFIPSLLEPLMTGELARHINQDLVTELNGCGGIRIEDNVLVTDTGCRNLTRPFLPH